jgi:sarcosine oxidase
MARSAEGTFDVLVLGAGIHGLCAAWQLRRRGVRRIAVLDRFAPRHARGSSHGSSRITRSSYHDARYVQLAQEARHEWATLARELAVEAIVPTPGVFFGPDVPRFAAFVATTVNAGAKVAVLDARDAQRRFPLLVLGGARQVLLDHTAGVVRADLVCAALRVWLLQHEVALIDETPVHALHAEDRAVAADTACGILRAPRVVLACGAGVGRLLPALASRFLVLRQSVGYFALHATPAQVRAPRFPVWARIGEAGNDFLYGLPAVGSTDVKVARHVTEGRGDDPEVDVPAPPAPALRDLDVCARTVFGARVRARVRAETCLYTMTRDQHFIVDALPKDARIVVCSACSGHGFKFGPVIGKMVADLVLAGARAPAAFAL